MNSCSCCSSNKKESKQVASLSNLLKIVSEENRLKLLCILRCGEHCVCELIEHVGLSQSLTSHHLQDLKKLNLVKDDKRGLKVYYRLTDKGKHVTDLLFRIPQKEVEL